MSEYTIIKRKHVLNLIRQIFLKINDNFISPINICEDELLKNIFDSMESIELIMIIEEVFNKKLDDTIINNLKTVKDLLELIMQLKPKTLDVKLFNERIEEIWDI